jgi:hypothetical protein
VTAFPAAATFTSDDAQTEGEFRQACDDFLAATRQLLGAAGVEALTIATGSVTPTRGTIKVDTEGAAATDTLSNIVTTNLPDGSLLLLKSNDNGRVVTVAHNDGGAGQISLQGGLDLDLNITSMQLLLQRIGSDWLEVARFGREKEHEVDAAGEPAFTNSWTGASNLYFWKDANGVVRMRGAAVKTSVAATSSAVFTLPAGYRPSADLYFPCFAQVAGAADFTDFITVLSSNGNVVWNRSVAPSTQTVGVWFESVSFRATA